MSVLANQVYDFKFSSISTGRAGRHGKVSEWKECCRVRESGYYVPVT